MPDSGPAAVGAHGSPRCGCKILLIVSLINGLSFAVLLSLVICARFTGRVQHHLQLAADQNAHKKDFTSLDWHQANKKNSLDKLVDKGCFRQFSARYMLHSDLEKTTFGKPVVPDDGYVFGEGTLSTFKETDKKHKRKRKDGRRRRQSSSGSSSTSSRRRRRKEKKSTKERRNAETSGADDPSGSQKRRFLQNSAQQPISGLAAPAHLDALVATAAMLSKGKDSAAGGGLTPAPAAERQGSTPAPGKVNGGGALWFRSEHVKQQRPALQPGQENLAVNSVAGGSGGAPAGNAAAVVPNSSRGDGSYSNIALGLSDRFVSANKDAAVSPDRR
eukprot:gnl/TRDRNA2_/TRDRNA2_101723_c0_seq3.p1 gnl/TRDRNA2_/TRDRNA2_101723_c0~~gnl/TRDRNA2_/TRDRNA2_101723_c0_seq3.p1  ORF type:complete len:331 (+),score=38.38 gnl/TRDRNA2_/TRDRNA2_101723_c0_seq3:56-1048(+)